MWFFYFAKISRITLFKYIMCRIDNAFTIVIYRCLFLLRQFYDQWLNAQMTKEKERTIFYKMLFSYKHCLLTYSGDVRRLFNFWKKIKIFFIRFTIIIGENLYVCVLRQYYSKLMNWYDLLCFVSTYHWVLFKV